MRGPVVGDDPGRKVVLGRPPRKRPRTAEQSFKLFGGGRRAFLAKSGHWSRIVERGPWKNSPCLRLTSFRALAQKYLLERGEAFGRMSRVHPAEASVSGKTIPSSPASPMQGQMAMLDQRSQMLLDRVAAGTTDPHDLGHRDPAMLAHQFQDQHRQLRQGGEHYSLALHLLFEALLLAPQGPQEELQPGVPVRRFGTDRSLRPPERQVVALLALLDHALQRTVRHIGIARPQQHQRRQDARQPAVAVLKRMDFQKQDRKST